VWFRKLFPEVIHYVEYDQELPGSEIVTKIEQHSTEIDRRIAPDVRNNGVLEEINSKFPEAIEAMYSPFRYASRAKDHYYQNLISKESDPRKIDQLKAEHQVWKERVHRLLMVYIQTYGLGRLIGPHLNWTGIYRSDEWLMEHFHNPSGHVPRSIMPAFPFDDSKFYALTYMLDKLAVHNRDAIRQVWDNQGFDAKQAYDMLCAQCHGIEMFGNGTIAEWLYPIPKNLRNAEFLRNLTKDRVAFSIIHGVKGTPMPPWGEFAEHKLSEIQKSSHGIPVLKEDEVHFLVDWLYSELPGGEVIKGTGVPKWQYTPEDVIQELEREGSELKTQDTKNGPALSSMQSISNQYYASLEPVVYPQNKSVGMKTEEKIEDLFSIVPNPTDTHEMSYFIKKKYYTPENIDAGKEFFLINCAVCHGNEGEGSGKRSEIMVGAKPRMLTNLDWVQSRDDLRLLRSIKYGVPGTAMTPWGDFTSSLQRLQLVMFIRSLSEEHERREKLSQALYQAFDIPQVILEAARIEKSIELQKLQSEQKQLQSEEEGLIQSAISSDQSLQGSLQVYERKLALMQQIQKLQEHDQEFLTLKNDIKKERDIYFNLGASLINKHVNDSILDHFIEMIKLNDHRYSVEDHRLIFHQTAAAEDEIVAQREKIIQNFDQQIAQLRTARLVLEGKIATEKRREELSNNQIESDSLSKLKAKLITETQEALRLVQEQRDITAKINSLI
jgi:mono/diheme cytochrome c family protein